MLFRSIILAERPGPPLPEAGNVLLDARPEIQQPGPQRAKQAFVSRTSQHVDRTAAHVDRQMPRRLRGIDQHERSGVSRDRADVVDWLDNAGHVGSVQQRDQLCVGPQSLAELRRLDAAIGFRFDVRRLDADALPEFAQWRRTELCSSVDAMT